MLQKLLIKPLVELEHMCHNGIAMSSNSFQQTSLLFRFPPTHQKLFVAFRFQGANLQRLQDLAVCDAVSRPNCGSDARANDCTCGEASAYTRSIEEVVCPKHRGRFEPEASRVLFTSDEEHSLRAMQERSCSVFMIPLLCDPGRTVFIRRSLATFFTVSSCFHCFVSEEERTLQAPAPSAVRGCKGNFCPQHQGMLCAPQTREHLYSVFMFSMLWVQGRAFLARRNASAMYAH